MQWRNSLSNYFMLINTGLKRMQADYLGLHISNHLVTNLPIWLVQYNLT